MNSAAVLLAVEQEEVAKLVAIASAGLHGTLHAVTLRIVRGPFQAGRRIILLVYRQGEREDDAISFLTGHLIHPVLGIQAIFTRVPCNQ
jgi:hypothetical protein